MRPTSLLLVVVAAILLPGAALARRHSPSLDGINRRLAGTLVDYTHNHGADRRIWSPVLQARRDLYVYLPPGFDPGRAYPVLLWLHGINQDEETFIKEGGLYAFDVAIACGRLPPLIIAIPDGTVLGQPRALEPKTLFANSNLGPFEDYLIQDVWGFVTTHYPILPRREAHVIGGFSGGGSASFRIAIRYRERFGIVIGLLPPVNLRWLDCHGRYFSSFDPNCWGWRTNVTRGREVVGRFYGVVTIRIRALVYPLFGRGPEALPELIHNNPIEMIDNEVLLPGQLAMYLGYGGRDQFNVTAQAESFIYRARQRGLCISVGYDPRGTHSWRTAEKLLPGMMDWLCQELQGWNPQLGCAEEREAQCR